MGLPSFPGSEEPLYKLLYLIAHSNAYTVVGGGDSVAAVEKAGLTRQISFCSTGGGSTLAYISHASLAGLDALSTNGETA